MPIASSNTHCYTTCLWGSLTTNDISSAYVCVSIIIGAINISSTESLGFSEVQNEQPSSGQTMRMRRLILAIADRTLLNRFPRFLATHFI